ncbi:hypothetical protein [Streptomyces albus]|uniref:hypothetical protein n=1 Tax=Streptomyces albus TaxID=1888 RepID=UPI003F1DFF26
MGREEKRKKQARRDQRARRKGPIPRQPEGERFSSVAEALDTGQFGNRSEAAQSTVRFLVNTYAALEDQAPDGPACGGPLLIHADGGFQCTAGCPGGTKVLHVPEALHFCDYADRLGITGDELGHVCPECTVEGASGHPRRVTFCTGVEIEHQNGTTTCSLGTECTGLDTLHPSGQTCGLLSPCEQCGITTPLLG